MNGFSKTLNDLDADTLDRASTRMVAGTPTRGKSFQPKTRNKVPQLESSSLKSWLRVQTLNVTRHAEALRSFQHNEFGTDPASPSDAHIDAVNQLMDSLRLQLAEMSRQVEIIADIAKRHTDTRHLQQLMESKDLALTWVRAIEKIWDFYFELFGQRQSQFGSWLLGCDRIALDCYQDIYMGLDIPQSIPSPAPFSFMRTGFSPATTRRGIPIAKLGQQINPFPLIQLPYHRLVNPWTLGAILHEVSHNLQTDLNLRQVIPHAIEQRLLKAGMSRQVAATWKRWHSETIADLSGLLLGGPLIVPSLMDIAALAPETTMHFRAQAPHPTPYLRIFINTELLRRIGFPQEAQHYRSIWERIYPKPRAGAIPREILDTFPKAHQLVVDTICFTPYPQLSGKALSEVIIFKSQYQQMIQEAGERLATGTDPGIVPERFLIPASRWALDQRLAEPDVITKNFYSALGRR